MKGSIVKWWLCLKRLEWAYFFSISSESLSAWCSEVLPKPDGANMATQKINGNVLPFSRWPSIEAKPERNETNDDIIIATANIGAEFTRAMLVLNYNTNICFVISVCKKSWIQYIRALLLLVVSEEPFSSMFHYRPYWIPPNATMH